MLCFVIGVNRKMSPDELVYLGILGASVPVGFLFRYLSKSDYVFMLELTIKCVNNSLNKGKVV